MQISIDANGQTKPFQRHYLFCIGSGHAALALRTDYVQQLKTLHDELGFERVRFHGIFDEDMKVMLSMKNYMPLPGADNFYDLSFHQIGLAYDNILSCGMKPFVELDFMPEMLASGKQQLNFLYKANVTPPKDYAKWDALICRFVRFLLDRYGEEEVRSWYFEVWNEPNIHAFFGGTQNDYFRLYEHTARAVKSVDGALRVGGPATACNAWIPEFVAYCRVNGVPVDFISTHQYMGEALGHVPMGMRQIVRMVRRTMKEMKRRGGGSFLDGVRLLVQDSSEMQEFPKDRFKKNVLTVREQADGLPVYYTEWNASSTCTAPHNDTRKIAANAVRTILDVDGCLAGSAIFAFSDIFEEINMFPQEFSGGFGLMTINGIRKPAYRAFQMLRQVGNMRLILPEFSGDVGAAAFVNEDGMQILVYRTDLMCREKQAEEVILKIAGGDFGRATVQKIDETHCNPYRLWREMGSPSDMRTADAAALDGKCVLQEETVDAACEEGMLILRAELGVNDLYLYKLYKK